MKAKPARFHPSRYPVNAGSAMPEGQPIERRAWIEQSDVIAMIDKRIQDNAESARDSGRDQDFFTGTDAQVLMVSQLVGNRLTQLEQAAERRPTPMLCGQLGAC